MNGGHEAEIRASMGAHHDPGPSCDDAVAEGVVERTGVDGLADLGRHRDRQHRLRQALLTRI
jgi:hypothetical protein